MADNDLKRNLAEEVKRSRAFEAMMKTEGWYLYQKLLNHHIGTRTQNIFEPTPVGGELAEQHNKGAVYGLILARDLPRVTVDATKEVVEEMDTTSQPATEKGKSP